MVIGQTMDENDLIIEDYIKEWAKSDAGKFVTKYSVTKPDWYHNCMYEFMSVQVYVTAEMEAKKLSEFYLKWGKSNGNN
jgi:hypothetical protein